MVNRLALYLLSICVLIAFQNCGSGTYSKRQALSKGGTDSGFDGKIYAHYGDCGAGDVRLSSQIKVSNDGKRAVLLMDECEKLDSAEALDVKELVFAHDDKNVMAWGEDAFDYQSGASDQKLTAAFCRPASGPQTINNQVWTRLNLGRYGGKVVDANGGTTGQLVVRDPVDQGTFVEFTSETGTDGSKFDLQLKPDLSATFTYQLGASVSGSVNAVCATQMVPDFFGLN